MPQGNGVPRGRVDPDEIQGSRLLVEHAVLVYRLGQLDVDLGHLGGLLAEHLPDALTHNRRRIQDTLEKYGSALPHASLGQTKRNKTLI